MDYTKVPLVFNVEKPAGYSSFNVVHHFKKNLNFDFGKIGHFGTLDPFAEGVLLIGIQGAQRLNEYVHQLLPKTYRATGVFGQKTESGDLTSPVTLEKDIDKAWQESSVSAIEAFLLPQLLGEYWQSPHAVSATKFEGKRLYRLAKEGKFIEKEKVKRKIYAFSIHEFNYPFMDFSVTVSSGTYVRSLFEEIAQMFNGVGALKTLKRTAIGDLLTTQSLPQEHWPSKSLPFDLARHGLLIDSVLILDQVKLTLAQTKRYVQGQRFKLNEIEYIKNIKDIYSSDLFWIYNEDATLLGLGKAVGEELHAVFNLPISIALFS